MPEYNDIAPMHISTLFFNKYLHCRMKYDILSRVCITDGPLSK